MDPFIIALTLMVIASVGGLLVGLGWCSCECEDEDEWDDEATFTTSYPHEATFTTSYHRRDR